MQRGFGFMYTMQRWISEIGSCVAKPIIIYFKVYLFWFINTRHTQARAKEKKTILDITQSLAITAQ